MKKYSPLLRSICFLALALAIFSVLTQVFRRKTPEGAWNYTEKVGAFYNEAPQSMDVLVFGASHAFCTVNPTVLEEYGVTGYVLATQQQPIMASYYYMVEALKTQSPDVIILEAFMVNRSPEVPEDSVIADATEPLPFSRNKLQMIAAMTEGKTDKVPYYLTLFRYNERWKELTLRDFTLRRAQMNDPYRGYAYLTEVRAAKYPEFDTVPPLRQINAQDLRYLEKIVALCEEKKIRLVLLYAPFEMDEENYAMDCTMKDFAAARGLDYLDGYELLPEFGLDFRQDFYDFSHLNADGSEKVTRYLAQYLLDQGYVHPADEASAEMR